MAGGELEPGVERSTGSTEHTAAATNATNGAATASVEAATDVTGAVPSPPLPRSTRNTLDSSPFWEPQRHVVVRGQFGRYRILEAIGEGGMGVVYLAEQDNPRRRVALKLIKGGFDSARVLRRLEFEAHILAKLQHPGIAAIIESSVAITDHGAQPYFAMEYVEGERLTEYARNARLSTRRRLELLSRVCEAVHHAHQRGVVHRDLKPGNILVTADGQPKILDFGVGAVTDGSYETTTQHTRTGQFVGTLPYMSPEQVSGDPRTVDTRTDVYALGVLGYELLTGRLPLDLKDKPLPEAVRIIQEDTPPSMSTLDRALGGEVQRLIGKAMEKDRDRRYPSADAFAADIGRFLRDEPIEARGDSAWYVLRKYIRRHRWMAASAALTAVFLLTFAVYAGVQADINRHLAEEQSKAHLAAVAAKEVAVTAKEEALTAKETAVRLGEEAGRERDEARKAREAEEQQRKEAENEARRAQSVTAFLVRTLGLADPDVTQTPDLTIRQMLDEASSQIETSLSAQPAAEATVRTVIGRAYATLGDLELARVHLERALELRRLRAEEEPEALYETLLPYFQVQTDLNDVQAHNLGYELQDLGLRVIKLRDEELATAVSAFRARTASGSNPMFTDSAFHEARALAERKLAPDDPMWLYVADQFLLGAYRLGYRDGPGLACGYIRGALDIQRRLLPETHTRVVRTLNLLITYSLGAGEARTAEGLAQQTLALLAAKLPENHWYLHVYRGKLAACLIPQGRQEEAEPLLLSALNGVSASRGDNNSYVAEIHKTLAALYASRGEEVRAREQRSKFASALTRSSLVLAWREVDPVYAACAGPAFGEDLEELAQQLDGLRSVLSTASSEVTTALERVIESRRQFLEDEDPQSAVIADLLSSWQHAHRNRLTVEASEAMLREALCIYAANPHDNTRKVAEAHWRLGAVQEQNKQFVEGEGSAREALRLLDGVANQDYGFTGATISLLGGCVMGQGRLEEAEPILREAFENLLSVVGPGNGNTSVAFGRLLRYYKAADRTGDAGELIADYMSLFPQRRQGASVTIAALRQILHDPSWPVAAFEGALPAAEYCASLLPGDAGAKMRVGIVLYRAGRFAEAHPYLRESDLMLDEKNSTGAAYRAMVEARLGRADEAQSALQRLEEIVGKTAQPGAGTLGLLAEARAALAGLEPAPAPPSIGDEESP
ncbi:MAG: serine/threonine protein kinase [Phycisphaerales bacterium]|nr:serine/threonine protein kinase [Phycisphaerales bacterium]